MMQGVGAPEADPDTKMKAISAGDLAPLCRGVHAAEPRPDGLVFQRFPPDLGALYDTPQRARVRRECPSGVRLRFLSDTARLALAVRYGPHARALFRGNLLVDGKPHPWGPMERAPGWEGEVFHARTRIERLFDLWLPHLCRTDLVRLALDDRASLRPAPALRPRWLALGDSITQGMTADLPTATHTALLSLQLGMECWNLGVGGSIFIEGLEAAIPALPDIDLVTVAYGSNDFHKDVPVASMRARLERLLTALEARFPGGALFLLTPVTWVDPPEPNALGHTLDDYRECIRETGQARPRVNVVPGPELVPYDPACFVDNVHPSNLGFAHYAEKLAGYLRP